MCSTVQYYHKCIEQNSAVFERHFTFKKSTVQYNREGIYSAVHKCSICMHFCDSDWSRIQDSPWSRFPNMPLPIPCVLELTFFRRGARHQLFVAYSVHGQQFVCLNIQTFVDIWSGWHGAWNHNGEILDIFPL